MVMGVPVAYPADQAEAPGLLHMWEGTVVRTLTADLAHFLGDGTLMDTVNAAEECGPSLAALAGVLQHHPWRDSIRRLAAMKHACRAWNQVVVVADSTLDVGINHAVRPALALRGLTLGDVRSANGAKGVGPCRAPGELPAGLLQPPGECVALPGPLGGAPFSRALSCWLGP